MYIYIQNKGILKILLSIELGHHSTWRPQDKDFNALCDLSWPNLGGNHPRDYLTKCITNLGNSSTNLEAISSILLEIPLLHGSRLMKLLRFIEGNHVH